jgi:serine protease Do
VTSGIISNIARTTGSGSPYDRFIQTDASINQGNSGGPMFDLNGNVIGVNTWIASNSGGNIGLGFAIPGEIAAPIVEKLMKGQTIERGYLGVNYGPLNDKLASALGVDKSKGVFVSGVPEDGPAGKAGIKPRDVIISVGGKTIDIDNPLSVVIGAQQIGKAVPVELIRNGKMMKVTATLTKRPSETELSGGFNQQEEEGLPEPQFSQKLENENAHGVARPKCEYTPSAWPE